MVREKYLVLGRLEQPRLNKNILYRHDKPNKPAKEGPLSLVLFDSPFASVSTVSRGHLSLVSLFITKETDPIPCLLKKILLFPLFFYFRCAGTATLWQNDCIATVLDASAVAAIATIIAVSAVVVAAVDGSSEEKQFASKCG